MNGMNERWWFFLAEEDYPNKAAKDKDRHTLGWRTAKPHMTPCVDVKKLPKLRQTDAGKSVKK